MDTVVTEGSLAAIMEQYSIPAEYELYVLWPAQRPYSSYAPGVCISVATLEAGLRFPLHPCWESYSGEIIYPCILDPDGEDEGG
ncbi:hypothetical protein GW17_00035188 [Ensete ventricosum]|nr:hypothetical protein GW17_00035188 [Ensete ventricosum]